MVGKQRLDVLLLNKGYFKSREQARASIMAGEVMVNDIKIDKPGASVPADAQIRLNSKPLPYVSRGGLKLEKALNTFNIDLNGKIVIDCGASTGGFTDCALQHGAAKVYAVDVGYGQLAWSLRQDPRVVVLERTNVRYLEPTTLGELADVITIDLAFISLNKVLPNIIRCLKPDGEIIALVKPQFEAGPDRVGKKGVVRKPETHKEILREVLLEVSKLNINILGLSYSPITGPKGNIEFLLWLGFKGKVLTMAECKSLIDQVVASAHQELK
ncbi:MAG: rRNA (cytidine1920-2-O)/16S rRNA (cytidine1409-2-O)-methyltransferase [Clostridia bacterium]|nr:rRNA (cytidine1920-2-O)/16S rRNA (cytidine1409-2-O)-methyltransferase [Clostridia bacterium]